MITKGKFKHSSFVATGMSRAYPYIFRLAFIAGISVVSTASPAQTHLTSGTKQMTPSATDHDDPSSHPYLGMWVTADGHIRHELLPTGRYDEQRGQRVHAYRGRYWIKGNQIAYLDDTGFTADGEFRNGRFYHGGYVFLRCRTRACGTPNQN
jgi:hypothetical protein